MSCAERPGNAWRVEDDRGNRISIDPTAFAANLAAARAAVGADVKIFQVVKGDGYGLGLETAVSLGLSCGVDGFCVGTPAEARRLQALAPGSDTLLFTACPPAALPRLAAGGTIVTVHSAEAFRALAASGVPARFFLELDCGFGRYGLGKSQLEEVLAAYPAQRAAACVGAYTHFGMAAGSLLDPGLARFDAYVDAIRRVVSDRILTMVASTDTMLARPVLPYSAVDPGRLLYGLVPQPSDCGPSAWRPVLTEIASTLTQVTPVTAGERLKIGYGGEVAFPDAGRTGVFPLGWLDGLASRGPFGVVLVGGRPAPVIARTLLHSIIDLTDVPGASPGAEVILVGRQGGHELDLDSVAASQQMNALQFHFMLPGAVARGATARP